MSDMLKLLDGSDRESEVGGFSSEEEESEKKWWAGSVSIVRVRELSGSEPSVLRLPAELENAAEATEISPSVNLSAVGVNVAV